MARKRSARKRLQLCAQSDPLVKSIVFYKKNKKNNKNEAKFIFVEVKNYVWSRSKIFDFFDLKYFHTILNINFQKFRKFQKKNRKFPFKIVWKWKFLRSKKSKIFETSTKIFFASFFIKLFKIFIKTYSCDERVTLSTQLETFARRTFARQKKLDKCS